MSSDTSTYSSTWKATTLRVKDPKKSIEFYEKCFECKLVDAVHGKNESRYFLARPKQSDEKQVSNVEAGTDAAHEQLLKLPLNYVELLHVHGTESDAQLKYDSGNNEPNRGFGHIAFNTKDVYASCEKLEKHGVEWQKKPDEGRMKGLAFVKDPDGYWIEIVRRAEDSSFPEEYNLSQTMLRVKDPVKSVAFYTGLLQMKLLCARHFSDFSLYFLMSAPPDAPAFPTEESQRNAYMKNSWLPVLELTHNHGTEKDESFKHHDGNHDPKGFCSIAFAVDNLAAARKALEHSGVQFADAELAAEVGAAPDKVEVVQDPDGYAVKLIAQGAKM